MIALNHRTSRWHHNGCRIIIMRNHFLNARFERKNGHGMAWRCPSRLSVRKHSHPADKKYHDHILKGIQVTERTRNGI